MADSSVLPSVVSVVASSVVAWLVAQTQVSNSRKLEAIKAKNEFLREKQKELFRLRDAVRDHKKAWDWIYGPGIDDPEPICDYVLERRGELEDFLQILRDYRLYLDSTHRHRLEEAIDECKGELEHAEELEEFHPDVWHQEQGDISCSIKISKANKKLTKVAEGLILISMEHMFAYFEDRLPNWGYCKQVENDHF